MTQLVVDAERRSELPPTRVSPGEVLQQRPPALPELRAALSLRRLSRAIATCVSEQNQIRPNGSRDGLPDDPTRMPEWIARVSHAVLRLFVVGAALAGVYKEPLMKAREHPDPDIRVLARIVPADYSRGSWKKVRNRLTEKEIAFLLQFAVCDLDASLEAQDDIFGPVAEWLVDSILSDSEARRAMADRFEQGYGRALYCLKRGELDAGDEPHPCTMSILADGGIRGGTNHSDAHLVVWELMKMFWLVQQFRFENVDYNWGLLDRYPWDMDIGAEKSDELVVVVHMGMFIAEEMLLPSSTSPAVNPEIGFVTSPVVLETRSDAQEDKGHGVGEGTTKRLPRSMSVAEFFDFLFHHSRRTNHYGLREPVAPLEFTFFEYFLQRHLGLCLHPRVFREEIRINEIDGSIKDFVDGIAIFSDDQAKDRHPFHGSLARAGFLDGSEMLTQYPRVHSSRFYERVRVW